MESEFKNKFQASKKSVSCIEPKGYSDRFIKYINQLTDLKEIFISEEIKERGNGGNEEEENDEDSDDSNILISKSRKDSNFVKSFDLKNDKGNNLLLPLYPNEGGNVKRDIKSVIYGSMSIKDKIK